MLHVQYKCQQETPLAKHTMAVLVLLHACVSLIFAVSLPPVQQILCIHVWILIFVFSELGDTFTAAQLFSSSLFVIHIP